MTAKEEVKRGINRTQTRGGARQVGESLGWQIIVHRPVWPAELLSKGCTSQAGRRLELIHHKSGHGSYKQDHSSIHIVVLGAWKTNTAKFPPSACGLKLRAAVSSGNQEEAQLYQMWPQRQGDAVNGSLAGEQAPASRASLTDIIRWQSESPGYFSFDNFSRNFVPPALVCLSGSGECLWYFQQENTRSDSLFTHPSQMTVCVPARGWGWRRRARMTSPTGWPRSAPVWNCDMAVTRQVGPPGHLESRAEVTNVESSGPGEDHWLGKSSGRAPSYQRGRRVTGSGAMIQTSLQC